jgi:hypothetical protein
LPAADSIGGDAEIAVIAAGILYALSAEKNQGIEQAAGASFSNWKKTGRDEGLR